MHTPTSDAPTRISIYPLARPAPADDATNPDERAHVVAEYRHWLAWPWEVEVEQDGATANLYGHEAREFLAAFLRDHPAQG
jgi:hypothetical protein